MSIFQRDIGGYVIEASNRYSLQLCKLLTQLCSAAGSSTYWLKPVLRGYKCCVVRRPLTAWRLGFEPVEDRCRH